MADPSAEEFASWLRPRDALSRLGDAASKNDIVARILDARIRIAGHSLSKLEGEPGQASQPRLVDLNYLRGPWAHDWREFWSSGQVSFARVPTALEGFATVKIVGPAGTHGQPEIHIFREVRLDPVAMAREFDLDCLPGTAATRQDALPPKRKGGRPAGKHGEPIARVTMRMDAKSAEELRRYTAEALGVELMEEYRKLGLHPPSEANALRDAAGILRVVRGL